MDIILIGTLIIIFLCLVALSWFAGSDAPFVATKMQLIKEVLITSGLTKGKNFYELGSGDGRVVLEAAKLGATSYGVEQSWLRVWYSRIKAKNLKLKNAHFYHGDIFQREYFPADVIYIYLLQKAVDKLEPKLQKELKKGTIVITQTYHFKKWKPLKQIEGFNLYKKI